MIPMKIGDVVFQWDNSILSKVIRLFDHNGRFSHVAICINDNEEILEAQYYEKSNIVPFYFQEYKVVSLGLTDEQRNRIQELAPTLIGRKYDFIEILSIFIRNVFDKKFGVINSPKEFICSEIVVALLQKANVIPNDKNLDNLTPNELFDYLKSLQGR